MSQPSSCPSEDTLLAFVGGLLRPESAAPIEAHIDGCSLCMTLLAEAGRELGDSSSSLGVDAGALAPLSLAPGDKIGRYHLLEQLGRGAMGVVFAAWDPDLDRRVAIKIVRTRQRIDASQRELESRSLREAQAMARLAHENVVGVYDVGSVDGALYLAMELVTGRTLRAWLGAAPRTWREVLGVLLQAGDGLAAAHAAGIVHRDFKPDNVLVGFDGRVRVTDFGLARMSLRDDAPPGDALGTADLLRTQAGTIIGTPAYMAPEQLDGAPDIDARADVFAFAAVAYEALFGERPYPAATLGELEVLLRTGAPREPTASKVPRWVRRAILAALVGDRARRTPDVATLLARLRADPTRRALRIAAPFAVALAGAAVMALVSGSAPDPGQACHAGSARAREVFAPARREAVRAAFTASPRGPEIFSRLERTLDAYLAAWTHERGEACDATHARAEQSAQMLELRLACLDQRLAEGAALVAQLARADSELVRRAEQAVGGLPAPAMCSELERLRARVAPPTDPVSTRLANASSAIAAQATAADLAGRWKEGAIVARLSLGLAEGSRHPPTRAEALAVLARLTQLAGDMGEARELFPRAITTALEAGEDRIVAEAATGFTYLLSLASDNKDEALRWAALAEAEIARLGGDDELTLRLLLARASVQRLDGRPGLALADYQRAAALQEKLEGVDAPSLVLIHSGIASCQRDLERFEEALESSARAEAIAARTLDPRHPEALNLASNTAFAMALAGRGVEALAKLEAIRPTMLEVFGVEHWNTSANDLQRALALFILGRYDDADRACGSALAVDEKLFAKARARVAYSHLCLAYSAIGAGRGPQALAAADQALSIARTHAANHAPFLAELRLLRAEALELTGRFAEAVAEAESSAEELAAAHGPSSHLGRARALVARALVRDGRPDDAVAPLREALAAVTARQGADAVARVPLLRDLALALEAIGRPDSLDEAADSVALALALLETRSIDPLQRAELRFAQARLQDDAAALADAERLAASSPFPRARTLEAAIVEWLAHREAPALASATSPP